MPTTTKEIEKWWDARPCNIGHGEASPGSALWSQQVTARRYWVESHIPEFADFRRWKGKRVLEIGCGIGTDTLQFVKNGAEVDAIDLSMESLHLAGDRF